MKKKMFIRKDEEGVSPVIATILMVAITVVLAAVLYIMVITMTGPGRVPPTGTWGKTEVKSSTEATADFGVITPEQRPMDLKIVLIRNETAQGLYSFSNNDDGTLILESGEDVGTLTYMDLMDNQRVNNGDKMRMTDLAPGSSYELIMAWVPTGDQIDSTTFTTTGY